MGVKRLESARAGAEGGWTRGMDTRFVRRQLRASCVNERQTSTAPDLPPRCAHAYVHTYACALVAQASEAENKLTQLFMETVIPLVRVHLYALQDLRLSALDVI